MPRPTDGVQRRPPSTTRDGVGTAALRLTPWGLRHLRMALWTIGDFAPCAVSKGSAFGNRDLGCPPFVGKSGRRGILRQAKVWLCSHTGCMARRHTAGMAEKARRAPQTHGRWVALTRKKSSKTFIFWFCGSFSRYRRNKYPGLPQLPPESHRNRRSRRTDGPGDGCGRYSAPP